MSDMIKRVILAEMITLYRAPSQVQNADQGVIYQTAIIETLAQFNPTGPELRRMWERFKRSWTKTVWPTPGELCQALMNERRPQAPPATKFENQWEPMTPAEQAAFTECVRKLRANPERYFASEALLKMADHFEKRDR